MSVKVRWIGGDSFVGEGSNGASVVMCADDENPESIKGVSPLQMLLLGVGGCASTDVVMILKKARQQVAGCECEISFERRDEMPRIYTKIHLNFVVTGTDISENHLARAVQLSAEKYCSASAMLQQAAEITHSYEIKAAE